MAYTPVFTPTYEDGWEDLPLETTPITAEALNNYDEAIEHIEEYLEQGGGGSEVSITPTLQSGTKIADFEIDGEPGALYAPTGGGDLSVIAEEHDPTKSYSEDDFVTHDGKLYKCISPTSGTFEPTDWIEVTVMEEVASSISLAVSKVPQDNIGFVNSDLNRAEKAYIQGEIFYMEYGQKVAIALTNIALGDPLILHTNYEYTTISEAMASGGGGGTTVVANPTGTPTDNLDTIQIGNTIYDIPGSGGGSSTLAGLTDTTITSPTSGQVLKYDATNQKWVNANESGGGNSDSYSTTEQAIGTWVDGRTIYRKCFTITSVSPPNPGNWCTLADVSITDLDFIIKGFGYLSTTKVAKIYGWKINNNNVQCIYHTGDFKPATGEIISVDYVKTTV